MLKTKHSFLKKKYANYLPKSRMPAAPLRRHWSRSRSTRSVVELSFFSDSLIIAFSLLDVDAIPRESIGSKVWPFSPN